MFLNRITSLLGGRTVRRLDSRRTLGKAPLENYFGEPVFQHLERPAGNHPAARASEAVLDQGVARISQPAHALHRFVTDIEACLIAEELRNRCLIRRREAAVAVGSRPVEQQLCGVELDLHFRKLPLQSLKFTQRPSKLFAGYRIFARQVVAIASVSKRAGSVADALC